MEGERSNTEKSGEGERQERGRRIGKEKERREEYRKGGGSIGK